MPKKSKLVKEIYFYKNHGIDTTTGLFQVFEIEPTTLENCRTELPTLATFKTMKEAKKFINQL